MYFIYVHIYIYTGVICSYIYILGMHVMCYSKYGVSWRKNMNLRQALQRKNIQQSHRVHFQQRIGYRSQLKKWFIHVYIDSKRRCVIIYLSIYTYIYIHCYTLFYVYNVCTYNWLTGYELKYRQLQSDGHSQGTEGRTQVAWLLARYKQSSWLGPVGSSTEIDWIKNPSHGPNVDTSGGLNPSEKWKSVGIMTFPIYGKIKNMFQTTNQIFLQF